MQKLLRGNLRRVWIIVTFIFCAFAAKLVLQGYAVPESSAIMEPKRSGAAGAAANAEKHNTNPASRNKSDNDNNSAKLIADNDNKRVESIGEPAATFSIDDKPATARLRQGSKELLWKATSASGATLYLLGTIHVFRSEDYPLPEEMEKAFARARALIVEVDVTKADPEYLKSFVLEHGAYIPPDSLVKHLTENGNKAMREYCIKRGLPYEKLVGMKPWLVALQILQVELSRLGYDSKSGIDLHFLAEANKEGKNIVSLETMEFQLNLFASLADDLQEEDLDLTLVDLEQLPTDARDMIKAWKDGSAESMNELLTKDVKEHPELAPVQEKLVYERNITMANKLEEYLKKGSDTNLVAIGSGHLVGDRSVIDLLQKRGYKVSQVLAGDKI